MNFQSFDGWRVNRALPKRIGPCIAFPLHQVYLRDGRFRQTRSGPNWQGGIATLATCKHHLRCRRLDWEGRWIAAFTPRAGTGDSYLIFLGRVDAAFSSNYALSEYVASMGIRAWREKSAWLSPLGDLYSSGNDAALPEERRYDHRNYVVHPDHVRQELDRKTQRPKWHKDIEYQHRGTRPAVLLFDPDQTFLFDRPQWRAARALGRSGWNSEDLRNDIEKVKK